MEADADPAFAALDTELREFYGVWDARDFDRAIGHVQLFDDFDRAFVRQSIQARRSEGKAANLHCTYFRRLNFDQYGKRIRAICRASRDGISKVECFSVVELSQEWRSRVKWAFSLEVVDLNCQQ